MIPTAWRARAVAAVALVTAACASTQASATAQGTGPSVPGSSASAGAAAPLPRLSTVSGVYSEAQAKRGEAIFNATCSACHVASDYSGDAFRSHFVGGTAFDMYNTIRSSMPQDSPGSLTDAQYADVVAFMLKLNGLPSRSRDLPAVDDSLKLITVEAKSPQAQHLQHRFGRYYHGSPRVR